MLPAHIRKRRARQTINDQQSTQLLSKYLQEHKHTQGCTTISIYKYYVGMEESFQGYSRSPSHPLCRADLTELTQIVILVVF